MKTLRRIAFSLVIGALFALAMSTRFPNAAAGVSGLAAAAFMYCGFIFNERAEALELAQRSNGPDKPDRG